MLAKAHEGGSTLQHTATHCNTLQHTAKKFPYENDNFLYGILNFLYKKSLCFSQ